MVRQERRIYENGSTVWACCYKNLHSIDHWHFENELIACHEGSARVMLDGHPYTMKKGDCAFFHREYIHSIYGTAGSRLSVAQFGDIVHPIGYLKRPVFPDVYQIGARMEELTAEFLKSRPFFAEKMTAIITSILIDIFRGEESDEEARAMLPTSSKFRELLIDLEQRYAEYDFHSAAQFMNMSEAYFSRYFKKMVGSTFSHYLNILRVDHAIALLAEEDDVTVATVMAECGFNTLRNFNRVFHEITGFAPKNIPPDFSLNRRALLNRDIGFDPTQEVSIALTG